MDTSPQAFMNGQPVKGSMVTRQVIVVRTRPIFARLPYWILHLLERFGIKTTFATIGFREVFETEEILPNGVNVVFTYQTNFGED